jgi:phosphomevalonate kinase
MKNNKTLILINGQARHGKDTLASFLAEEIDKLSPDPEFYSKGIEIMSFALELKKEAYANGWNGEKDKAGRTFLQDWGHKRRAEDIDYWCKKLHEKIPDTKSYIIIPDWRYKNEYYYFTRNSSYRIITLKISRYQDGFLFDNGLTPAQKEHQSEVDLLDFRFDIQVGCESGLENVKKIAKVIARDYVCCS